MEGQFYRPNKGSNHPHTNMAKAALNMMTRTSAACVIAAFAAAVASRRLVLGGSFAHSFARGVGPLVRQSALDA